MKPAVLVATIPWAVLAVACGTILATPVDDPPSNVEAGADAPAADGSPTGANDASPPIVRTCPTRECASEDEDAGEVCVDDVCDDELDFDPVGTVEAVNGECVADGSGGAKAYLTSEHPRTQQTMSVALSFDIATATTERALASIRAGSAENAERFEAVVRNGSLVLCERWEGGGETCAQGVPLPKTGRVHLYGLLSSDAPARGSFALSLDGCTAQQLLPVSRPFATGAVVGSVGCLPGTGDCAIQMHGIVLFARPE